MFRILTRVSNQILHTTTKSVQSQSNASSQLARVVIPQLQMLQIQSSFTPVRTFLANTAAQSFEGTDMATSTPLTETPVPKSTKRLRRNINPRLSDAEKESIKRATASLVEQRRALAAAKKAVLRAKKMEARARAQQRAAARKAKTVAKAAKSKAYAKRVAKAKAEREAKRAAPLRTLSEGSLERTKSSRANIEKRIASLNLALSLKSRIRASIPKPLTLLSFICKEKQLPVPEGAKLLQRLNPNELQELKERLANYQKNRAEQIARVPKMAPQGFMKFCAEKRSELSASPRSIAESQAFIRQCANEWKQLSPQARADYNAGIAEARTKYNAELAAYAEKYAPQSEDMLRELEELKAKRAELVQTLRINTIRTVANTRRTKRA